MHHRFPLFLALRLLKRWPHFEYLRNIPTSTKYEQDLVDSPSIFLTINP